MRAVMEKDNLYGIVQHGSSYLYAQFWIPRKKKKQVAMHLPLQMLGWGKIGHKQSDLKIIYSICNC